MEEPTERQMSKMIEAHARGDITEDLRIFINGRQDFLDFARREFFKPSAVEKEKIRQYKNSSI